MRPQRLVLEGFLAYRHRAEVDFDDADLFVLSGPTGAGKSSVIDAMTFALYGAIPRLDDRRSVAPMISAQADRARVSFQFSVGEDSYTAARLVERTKSGARVTEARLQRDSDDAVLAGNGDEVTAEVTRLLGLGYDHFIKAVVLPQGAFADFLTDRPRDRQALLRALLELGLYEQVMQLANLRARGSEARAQSIQENLDKLDVPSPEQVDEARLGLAAMTDALDVLPRRVKEVDLLRERAEEAVAAGEAVRAMLGQLSSISMPPDLATLEKDRSSALQHLREVIERRDVIVAEQRELAGSIATLEDLKTLEAWRDARERLDLLRQKRSNLDLPGHTKLAEESSARRDATRAELEAARAGHAAHGLRGRLRPGDTCPVCDGVVATLPDRAPEDSSALDELAVELAAQEKAAASSRDMLKQAEGEARQIDATVVELEEMLADAPKAEEVDSRLARLRTLLGRMRELDLESKAVTEQLTEAEAIVSGLDGRTGALKEKLHAARDRVAALAPPLPGEDPVEGWHGFDRWRLEAIEKGRVQESEAREAISAARAACDLAVTGLDEWLGGLGVKCTGAPDKDLALAIERRSTEVAELEKTVKEAAEMSAELDTEQGRARIAASLGQHLKANNFEAWLLEEAMVVLIEGANHLLTELSAGSYSLKVRNSQFEVIDHRNARLTRTTKSLSGGETFLVALALSLSMAEQLAALTGMTSRLESVFLDEGFGSLDQESLDVVADVLDELVGRGRTVGIVTHVRELAERVPVRFEVSKGPETATIVRVGD